MGLNAYFAYTVVGFHGSGLVPFQVAVTAVFVEGWVFVALTLLGLRQWLARAIPSSIKLATGVGIGLYLTLIGLTYSAGIGAVVGATSTPLELAGCAAEFRDIPTDGRERSAVGRIRSGGALFTTRLRSRPARGAPGSESSLTLDAGGDGSGVGSGPAVLMPICRRSEMVMVASAAISRVSAADRGVVVNTTK